MHKHNDDPCFVAPAPELREKLDAELTRLRKRKTGVGDALGTSKEPRALGLNDGMILPPDAFPFGTPDTVMRASGLERAPLRGAVRVIVVLADTSDKPMARSAQSFRDLFFSTGVVPTGSVREYFREATHGLVDVVGEVVGPYRLPQTMAWYSNGNFGIGRPSGTTRARDMAAHALALADPHVSFGPYDNDGNGYVDAFIVVHSGRGGEETGNSGDIWSHKWVLPSQVSTDSTKVYGYLTIPEDAKLGVSAHELGHLLFGFPDLYDTDGTSEGVGNWCLMGGGSWNGGGNTPAHPSAWCKANQGWVTVNNVTANGTITIPDVKSSHQVHRLWKDGAAGSEYFLLENRQKTGFDAQLPGGGLLLWHVDENKPTNTDENHYKVGLLQADGLRQLETAANRGDAGDPFPGSRNVTTCSGTTTPSTKSFTGQSTEVSVTAISPSAATMTANVTVRAGKSVVKDLRDTKQVAKDLRDNKLAVKDARDNKDFAKDVRDTKSVVKDRIDTKNVVKDLKDGRKDIREKFLDNRWDWGRFGQVDEAGYAAGLAGGDPVGEAVGLLQAAIELLTGAGGGDVGTGGEGAAYGGAEPFIDASLRPDLVGGPAYDDASKGMAEGDASAKRHYDAAPQG
ncbi:MAG: M6 family metalloprotease domain-containing protein [Tetrasphaera sp.]|nr:M6 family metalloprotease domain-containing protein [Tetrasphaera sp.]